MEKKIKAYKGFDKDLKCRGFQYELNKEYETDKAVLCKSGFHACENPLDVLDYYNDIDGRYCEVELSGETATDGKKTVSTRIKVNTEVGFVGLFKLGVEWLITNPNMVAGVTNDEIYAQIGSSGDYAQIGGSGDYAKIGSSGDYAKIGSSGNKAQIGSSGDYAQIGSSGDYAKIGSSGNHAQIDSQGECSVVYCAGHNSIARAKIGSWITLSEWGINKQSQYVPLCVKTEYVDGDRIKADTWYELKNGKFVEVSK